jgi:hypothetical protein
MSKMQYLQPAVICRRRFFHSIGGLAVSLLIGDIPFLASNVPVAEQGFVIINGWVLTYAQWLGLDLRGRGRKPSDKRCCSTSMKLGLVSLRHNTTSVSAAQVRPG